MLSVNNPRVHQPMTHSCNNDYCKNVIKQSSSIDYEWNIIDFGISISKKNSQQRRSSKRPYTVFHIHPSNVSKEYELYSSGEVSSTPGPDLHSSAVMRGLHDHDQTSSSSLQPAASVVSH